MSNWTNDGNSDLPIILVICGILWVLAKCGKEDLALQIAAKLMTGMVFGIIPAIAILLWLVFGGGQ